MRRSEHRFHSTSTSYPGPLMCQQQWSRTVGPSQNTTFKAIAPSLSTSPQPGDSRRGNPLLSKVTESVTLAPRWKAGWIPRVGPPSWTDGREFRTRGVDEGHLWTWPGSSDHCSEKAALAQAQRSPRVQPVRGRGATGLTVRITPLTGHTGTTPTRTSPQRRPHLAPIPLPEAPARPPAHKSVSRHCSLAGSSAPSWSLATRTQSPPPQGNLAYGGPHSWAPPPRLPVARRPGSAASATHRVIGEQPCIVVQHEPTVLPALHHVSPFAQRPFHNGRHLGSRQWQQTAWRQSPIWHWACRGGASKTLGGADAWVGGAVGGASVQPVDPRPWRSQSKRAFFLSMLWRQAEKASVDF